MSGRNVLNGLMLAIIPALMAAAGTDTVLILHTNDMHDHIRPGYESLGGLPYVSGYIHEVKSKRPDTLVVDAGDVMEKGDMVAFETESAIMYEAMGRAGFQVGTLGNHDFYHGFAHLCECLKKSPEYILVCANWPEAEGSCLVPSKLIDVDGVKVGVIGLTKPQDKKFSSNKALAGLLSREAARLEPEAHILIASVHLGSKDCEALSRLAPEIDVFVSGHTHEILTAPKIVEKTGAIIVQAGQYARYVGRLELTVDLDTEKIVRVNGELVEMRHDKIPCDQAMLAWIQQKEQDVCPEASQTVGRCENEINNTEAGLLAAAALREKTGADIGFCHPGAVIRSGLPKGDIDVNALFLTGGQRGRTVITTSLTGAQIEEYFRDLVIEGWGRDLWVGFKAAYQVSPPGTASLETNLEAERSYKVVMPELEWNSRFLKAFEKKTANTSAKPPKTETCAFTFTEAFAAYAESLNAKGISLDSQLSPLRETNSL